MKPAPFNTILTLYISFWHSERVYQVKNVPKFTHPKHLIWNYFLEVMVSAEHQQLQLYHFVANAITVKKKEMSG